MSDISEPQQSIVLWQSANNGNSSYFKLIMLSSCLLFGILSLRGFVNWVIVRFKMVQKAFEDIKRIFQIIDELKCENKVKGDAIKNTEEQLLSRVDDVVEDFNNDLEEHKTDLLQTITGAISTHLREVSLKNSKLSLEIQELRFQLEHSQKLIQDFDSKIESRANDVEWESGIFLDKHASCKKVAENSDFIVVLSGGSNNGIVQLFNKSNSRKVYEYNLEEVTINGRITNLSGDRGISADDERLYMNFDQNTVVLGLKDGCLIHHIPVKNPTSVSVNESNIFVACHSPYCVKVFDKVKFEEVATFGGEYGQLMDYVAFDESCVHLVAYDGSNKNSKMLIFNLDDFTFVKGWEFPIAFKGTLIYGIYAQLNSRHLYVTNTNDRSVCVFDKENGNIIKKIGGPWSSTNIKCCFGFPDSVISTDSKGGKECIYVFDRYPNYFTENSNSIPMIKRVVIG